MRFTMRGVEEGSVVHLRVRVRVRVKVKVKARLGLVIPSTVTSHDYPKRVYYSITTTSTLMTKTHTHNDPKTFA